MYTYRTVLHQVTKINKRIESSFAALRSRRFYVQPVFRIRIQCIRNKLGSWIKIHNYELRAPFWIWIQNGAPFLIQIFTIFSKIQRNFWEKFNILSNLMICLLLYKIFFFNSHKNVPVRSGSGRILVTDWYPISYIGLRIRFRIKKKYGSRTLFNTL
jgi:hypothetical protein